jgi:hypothetical protein
MDFPRLLGESAQVAAGLRLQVTVVDRALVAVERDDALEGEVGGRRHLIMEGRNEEVGVGYEHIIVKGRNCLFSGVNGIAKLINLEVGFWSVAVLSRIVAKSVGKRSFIELLSLVHLL